MIVQFSKNLGDTLYQRRNAHDQDNVGVAKGASSTMELPKILVVFSWGPHQRDGKDESSPYAMSLVDIVRLNETVTWGHACCFDLFGNREGRKERETATVLSKAIQTIPQFLVFQNQIFCDPTRLRRLGRGIFGSSSGVCGAPSARKYQWKQYCCRLQQLEEKSGFTLTVHVSVVLWARCESCGGIHRRIEWKMRSDLCMLTPSNQNSTRAGPACFATSTPESLPSSRCGGVRERGETPLKLETSKFGTRLLFHEIKQVSGKTQNEKRTLIQSN